MTNFKKQILSVLSTGLLLAQATTPVFAGTSIVISGNGSSSDSEAKVEVKSERNIVQENNADIDNDVKAESNTGDNSASDNTTGDVKIDTGSATNNVTVTNSVNSNSADVDCCPSGDTEVVISGNGTHSDNEVELEQKSETGVFQSNDADVDNDVDADASTGGNDADDNTGGDVEIDTGAAKSSVDVSTQANANSAKVGGAGNSAGELSAWITGNGSYSDNEIELELEHETAVVQENDADIDNDVDADADTGWNDADDNTGGDVLIDTGAAEANVEVDNMVNFNWADVDCGCLLDLEAKIAGNGTDSDNEIKAEFEDALEAFQGNDADLDNDVDADADSGKNDADDNTGDVEGSDPSIETGNAKDTVEVSNSGNSNQFGGEADWEFPEVEVGADLSSVFMAFLAWFSAH
jgi:hypothetical protein